MLTLHAVLDGYALSFVDGDRRETLACFPNLPAAAGALRNAQAAVSRIDGLQAYNCRARLGP